MFRHYDKPVEKVTILPAIFQKRFNENSCNLIVEENPVALPRARTHEVRAWRMNQSLRSCHPSAAKAALLSPPYGMAEAMPLHHPSSSYPQQYREARDHKRQQNENDGKPYQPSCELPARFVEALYCLCVLNQFKH